MIHCFKINGLNIVLDVNSGATHVLDDLAYEIVRGLKPPLDENCPEKIAQKLSQKFSKDDILETYDEICSLYKRGLLFSKDKVDFNKIKKPSVIKALCLNVSHDCNLRCKYCFADGGRHPNEILNMSEDVAKHAIDFLLENSAGRHNLEVDFFGGEPLINFDVVKFTVNYARSKEKEFNKNFRFTITTNGVLLNDESMEFINREMDNVILSLDGRKEVNDRFRVGVDGRGSYDYVVQKLLKMARLRDNKEHYVRATVTRHNKDFLEDVKHMHDVGFKKIAIEPVVGSESEEYTLKMEDLLEILAEYDKLAKYYVDKKNSGEDFSFFTFEIDLDRGPCIPKRLAGCGVGCSYLAVIPNGDIYPCHQFVGHPEFKTGSVLDGDISKDLRKIFMDLGINSKPDCKNCFAKFHCGGGCVANARLIEGNFHTPYEIGCIIQRKKIECAIYTKCAEKMSNSI
jgi:uncharacterized protein